MKRILCILDSLSAGGAETFIMKLYRKLDKEQFQIDFIVCKDGIYDDEVKKLGGKIYHIPMRTQHFIGACRRIRSIVYKNGYDTVIKLGSSPIVITDLISAKVGGAKSICVRSCNAPTQVGFKMKTIEAILRPVLNLITDVKIAPSDLAAEYTFGKKQVNNGRVHFLRNAVDTKVYKYSKNGRERVRHEFCISENCTVVGHIGRFVKQKNHGRLIDIFQEFLKNNSDAKLLLVGEGELKENVEEYVKQSGLGNNVIFAGVRTDIPDVLSAVDVFLLPSLYEGMPNTVIESQALGLSCVISDSITKQANVTGNVSFCNLNESDEIWAQMLNQALSNKIDREHISKILINEGYDIDSSVEYFKQLLF